MGENATWNDLEGRMRAAAKLFPLRTPEELKDAAAEFGTVLPWPSQLRIARPQSSPEQWVIAGLVDQWRHIRRHWVDGRAETDLCACDPVCRSCRTDHFVLGYMLWRAQRWEPVIMQWSELGWSTLQLEAVDYGPELRYVTGRWRRIGPVGRSRHDVSVIGKMGKLNLPPPMPIDYHLAYRLRCTPMMIAPVSVGTAYGVDHTTSSVASAPIPPMAAPDVVTGGRGKRGSNKPRVAKGKRP